MRRGSKLRQIKYKIYIASIEALFGKTSGYYLWIFIDGALPCPALPVNVLFNVDIEFQILLLF